MSQQPTHRGRTITDALLAAMAHSTEPMSLSDPRLPDHPIIAVNAAFEAMTGYRSAEVVGRNCRLLQGPATDHDAARRLGRTIAAGQGCVEWIVNHRKDGSAFWNLLFLSPVHDADGTLLHFFGNQHDITEGLPPRLTEVDFGQAHMPPEGATEFRRLLREIAAATQELEAPAHARALEQMLTATRRLAEISTRLVPGPARDAGLPAMGGRD